MLTQMQILLLIIQHIFKYTSSLLGAPNATGALENAKIVVPLKYLSNFFRSLEMPLIN